MPGWVYIFVNAAVPNHVKVGFTDRDPEVRARELAVTGLPGEYSVAYRIKVENAKDVERVAHRLLGDEHYHKEWFQCSIDRAKSAIREAASGQTVAADDDLDDDNDGSPLIDGHPLGPAIGGYQSIADDVFVVAEEDPPTDRRKATLPGHAQYICPHCDHDTIVRDTPVAWCTYCGKSGFLR